MSKKIFVFLVSGLAIALCFSQAQAVTFGSGGFTVASGTSITLTGTPSRALSWSSYGGNAATATYATSAGTATSATSASTANALAANPTNCSAGYYPLGVDASGNAESCTLAATGGISGSGTANYLSKWTSASAQGNSVIYDNGTNVGIGTAAPATLLNVNGTTDTSLTTHGLFVLGPVSGGNISMDQNEIMARSNGAASVLYLNAEGGNVVIGETGSANVGIGTGSPASKLHVVGATTIDGGNLSLSNTAGQTKTTFVSYSNASSLWMIQPTTQKLVLADGVDWDRSMSIQYTAGTTAAAAGVLTIGQIDKNSGSWTHGVTRFYTNGTERMNINSAGTVTIPGAEVLAGGSSSNWASVNVGGAQSIQTAGSIYSYNSMCVGNNSGACNSTGGVVLGLTNSGANVNIPSSANVIFNNGYNVGIGTNNPTLGKLQVSGTSWANIYAYNEATGYGIYAASLNGPGAYLASTNDVGAVIAGKTYGVQGICNDGYGVYGQSNTGYAGYFNGKGKFTSSVEAVSFVYTSDRNLKKNIKTLDNSLDKIMQLRGVSFNWRKDGQASVGLIAQEVEKVYPELVTTDSNGTKAVEYGNLVAPLIEAVKAQQNKIDQLETRISILEMNK